MEGPLLLRIRILSLKAVVAVDQCSRFASGDIEKRRVKPGNIFGQKVGFQDIHGAAVGSIWVVEGINIESIFGTLVATFRGLTSRSQSLDKEDEEPGICIRCRRWRLVL